MPHLLTAVRGVTGPSLGGTEGCRTGTQAGSLSLQNDEKSLGVNCRREALTPTFSVLGTRHRGLSQTATPHPRLPSRFQVRCSHTAASAQEKPA